MKTKTWFLTFSFSRADTFSTLSSDIEAEKLGHIRVEEPRGLTFSNPQTYWELESSIFLRFDSKTANTCILFD